MKSLILFRHGPAGHSDETMPEDDAQRPLTPKGQKVSKNAAKMMRLMGARPTAVVTSPLDRAAQTAAIAAKVMGLEDGVTICDALRPGTPIRDMIEALAPLFATTDTLLVVGHEPDLSHLAATLVSGQPHAALELRKAGFCLLMADELRAGKCAVLRALLNPRGLEGDAD
jgi:phosphohistidine phosphatase